MFIHYPLRAVGIGALATSTMDIGALVGQKLGVAGGGTCRTGPDILGRWLGYLVRGTFSHRDILLAPPIAGEAPIGFVAHYAIGLVLTLLYFVLIGISGLAPAPWIAIGYSIATSIFAWCMMFPSQGYGVMGSRVPAPARLGRFSLYNHLIFGVGLAIWTVLLNPMA